jgi:acetyl esterase
MTLVDEATATFLEALRDGTPLHKQTIGELRAGVTMSHQQLGPPTEPVHHVVDRQVPVGSTDRIDVRVYTPRPLDGGTTLPLLVHYHGGGFVGGDLRSHDATARHTSVHADAIVVAVAYRRPPEHRFPVAVDDAYAALEWVAAHAGELGGNRQRIGVIGDSAGGNLAAVVCQLAKDRGGPAIACQALLYPQLDLDVEYDTPSRVQFGTGDYFLSRRDMQWLRSLYLADVSQAQDPRASPLKRADLSGLPPALIVAAGCDPLRDEGKAYADRLAAAGVPVEYRCFEQTIHAFVSFAAALPLGGEALAFIAGQLRAMLHSS